MKRRSALSAGSGRGSISPPFPKRRCERCSGSTSFEEGSLDFADSLGVLHHVPDTTTAFKTISRILKKDAPFLAYLYYENRPAWYQLLWGLSELARGTIAHLHEAPQSISCGLIALSIYWPLARVARFAEGAGLEVANFPLALYGDRDIYSMHTDARLEWIRFPDSPPTGAR